MSNSGVYIIKNIINDKVYVGSSINILKRRKEHLSYLKNNKHHSIKLQRAWNKYGENSFIFEPIQYCEKENLITNEQYWIDNFDSYNNGYNSTKEAISVIDRNRAKRGIPLSEKHKESIKNSKKNISKEIRLKLSIANTGKKHSDYTKEKIRLANLGRESFNKKPIIQLDLFGNFIKEWNSGHKAAKELNLKQSNINKVLTGKRNHTGKFIFKYKI